MRGGNFNEIYSVIIRRTVKIKRYLLFVDRKI